MKPETLLSAFLFCAAMAPAVQAQELTGDTRLACETILCLSSGTRPSECNPSLNRYYGISHKKWKDTLSARKSFLNLCPTASADVKMQSLVDAITNGAGRCDVASLNGIFIYGNDENTYISNQMPGYCNIWYSHEYTDLKDYVPVYVGVPSEGGFWIDKAGYANALKQYNDAIRERERRRRSD